MRHSSTINLLTLIKDSINLLTRSEKFRAFGVAYLLLFGSLLEMCALIGIAPLVGAIVEPEWISNRPFFVSIMSILGNPSYEVFVALLSFFAVLLMAFSFISVIWVQNRVRLFVVNCQNRLAREVMTEVIDAPYAWFFKQNKSSTAHHLFTDVLMWANDAILRVMQGLGSLSLILVAFCSLALITPTVGLITLLCAGIVALAVVKISKSPIMRLSEIRRDTGGAALKAANQIMVGCKDIRMSSKGTYFLDLYLKPFVEYGRSGSKLRLLQHIPPVVIMFLGQTSLILIALTLWRNGGSSGEIAAQISLIVLVMSRIIPAINRLVGEVNGMWASEPHVRAIIKRKSEIASFHHAITHSSPVERQHVKDWSKIRLVDIEYRYPGSSRSALLDINCEFQRGSLYGIVGASGAGKSTLVDILLGLLPPTEGCVYIDDSNLHLHFMTSWRSQIGYVSQHPYMLDDTLEANVAFGLNPEEVNKDRVIECLRMAQLSELFDLGGLDPSRKLGDFGSLLSGGQLQRVAIARALYHRPKLLVLDEATSALDVLNEKEIRNILADLRGKITAVVIAHRMTTILDCDSIMVLDHGRLIASGDYQTLLDRSEYFRALTNNKTGSTS